MDGSILYKDESYAIQGAVFEVYREIGAGFLEAVYQECLEREFTARNIPFVSQAELKMLYKGVPLQQIYKVDILSCGVAVEVNRTDIELVE